MNANEQLRMIPEVAVTQLNEVDRVGNLNNYAAADRWANMYRGGHLTWWRANRHQTALILKAEGCPLHWAVLILAGKPASHEVAIEIFGRPLLMEVQLANDGSLWLDDYRLIPTGRITTGYTYIPDRLPIYIVGAQS